MDATMDAAWDVAALNAVSWPVLWAEFTRQASEFLLLIMAASLVLLVIMALTPGTKEETGNLYLVTTPLVATSAVALAEAEPLQEQVPVPVAAGFTATEAQDAVEGQLVRSGLTPTDALAILSLRRRVEAGAVNEDPTESNRLAFARWLADHGRLER